MNAQIAVQTAVVAALRAMPELSTVAVFDAPPVRAASPHAVVGEPVLGDWSSKTWRGREGRLLVSVFDGGERPVRLRGLIGMIEDAVETIDVTLAGGWRIAGVWLVRSRIVRSAGDRWLGTSEFTIRLYRES